jgi:enoyl-CoA hydratase/carnithine racemase
MSDVVLYELRGSAARITINRPERRNALSDEVIEDLTTAIARAGEDGEARVVVLTGAGDQAFCAGADLGGFTGEGSRVQLHHGRRRLADLFIAMQRCPKPIVARVNGKALAGGFGLMLACDLVVAADDAEFGTPEINVGLWPYMITAVISRNVPRKVALEMMLTGKRVSAKDAARWGIVNRVVPSAELDMGVDELVDDLAGKSPLILRLGKESFYRAQDMNFEDALSYLHSMLTVNLESEDVIEGVTAFAQKRKPEWKGR